MAINFNDISQTNPAAYSLNNLGANNVGNNNQVDTIIGTMPNGQQVSFDANSLNFGQNNQSPNGINFNQVGNQYQQQQQQNNLWSNIGSVGNVALGAFNAWNAYQGVKTAEEDLQFRRDSWTKNFEQQLKDYQRRVNRQEEKETNLNRTGRPSIGA